MKITFESKLWKYQGKAAWYFVTLPQEESLQIKFANIPSQKRFWINHGQSHDLKPRMADFDLSGFEDQIISTSRKIRNQKEG